MDRRHPDLNWGIKDLQSSALPLGYAAESNFIFILYCSIKNFFYNRSSFSTVASSDEALEKRRARFLPQGRRMIVKGLTYTSIISLGEN